MGAPRPPPARARRPRARDFFSRGTEMATDGKVFAESEVADIAATTAADDLIKVAMGGDDDSKSSKKNYHVVHISDGLKLSSASPKYSGSAPSGVASKVGRAVYKENGKRSFEIILKRSAARLVDKKLFKYKVTVEDVDPSGHIFSAQAVGFKSVKPGGSTSDQKRISVVTKSPGETEVFGRMADGVVSAANKTGDTILRVKGSDTLVHVAPKIPATLGGKKVYVVTDRIKATRMPITEKEATDFKSKSRSE